VSTSTCQPADLQSDDLADPAQTTEWAGEPPPEFSSMLTPQRHTPEETPMDLERAKQLIAAERERIQGLLASSAEAKLDDSSAERDAGDGDIDAAQPLEHEAIDIAIGGSLQLRLDALTRAEQRIGNGSYGKSLESGLPIPDDRLEVDPAAELTVEEAAKHRHRDY
jgi:DnaK suppressor protein